MDVFKWLFRRPSCHERLAQAAQQVEVAYQRLDSSIQSYIVSRGQSHEICQSKRPAAHKVI